jgi:hypothetical protein
MIAASIAMIPITIISSIRVKPSSLRVGIPVLATES